MEGHGSILLLVLVGNHRGVLSCERWAVSGNLWAVMKTKYLVIGPLVSYNRGLKDIFWGLIIRRLGRTNNMNTRLWVVSNKKTQYVHNYGKIYFRIMGRRRGRLSSENKNHSLGIDREASWRWWTCYIFYIFNERSPTPAFLWCHIASTWQHRCVNNYRCIHNPKKYIYNIIQVKIIQSTIWSFRTR